MINADGVMSGRGIKAPDIMKIRREKKEAMNKTLRFKHVN